MYHLYFPRLPEEKGEGEILDGAEGGQDGGEKPGMWGLELKLQWGDCNEKYGVFTKIIDDQKMDWRARVGGRISSEGGLLWFGFLAPQDIERVFDACSRAGLHMKLKPKLKLQMQQERRYSLGRWFSQRRRKDILLECWLGEEIWCK